MRATFARWSDQLLAVFLLVVALAGARAWIATQPQGVARWLGLAVGFLVGLAAAGGVSARVAYQQSDGLLAADALHLRPRLRYVAAGQMLGLILLTLATLIVEPPLILMTIPGYAGGTLVATLMRALDATRLGSSRWRADWTIKVWSSRPGMGVAAAAMLIALLLAARNQATMVQWALAGSATVLIGLLLSRIDSAAVRFRTSVGQGFGQIFIAHSRGLLSFLAVAVAASWAIVGAQGAAVVATGASVLLLLFALRILAYRLLERCGADLLVSILVGLLALVGYSLTLALPFVAILMLGQLQRHGHQRRWLMR